MDFWMTIRVLLRRWYIALPVFALSLGLASAVFFSVSPQYESTGTIVLTAPSSGARVTVGGSQPAERINPLLAFDGSLTTSAQIVIETLKDPATLKQYETVDGMPATYAVGNGQLAGPFIVVVATAGTPAAAKKTAASVLDLARNELAARQHSLQAPDSTYIRADSVVNPTSGKALIGGKVRYAAVALLLGLIAGLTAAYGYESYKNYRKAHQGKNKGKDKAAKLGPSIKPAKAIKQLRHPEPLWPVAEGTAVAASSAKGTHGEEATRTLEPVAKSTPISRSRDPR
jgi:hypothetical protein